MSKWIKFQQAGDTGKTKIWDVVTKDGETFLGRIQWYSPWRQYCFYPFGLTIYAASCLGDISEFIEREMKARRA